MPLAQMLGGDLALIGILGSLVTACFGLLGWVVKKLMGGIEPALVNNTTATNRLVSFLESPNVCKFKE